MAITSKYVPQTGGTMQGGLSINDSRRIFNFGERVAELAPQQSPFFTYLAKVAKRATNDPVFKFLEQRHQWQRRNFTVKVAHANKNWSDSSNVLDDNMVLTCKYDKYGNVSATDQPCHFILPGQVIAVADDDGTTVHQIKIATDATIDHTTNTNTTTTITAAGMTIVNSTSDTDVDIAIGNKGQVIGSAWAEGSTAPDGWEDALFDREGYCQIFKTGMKLFSNTKRATVYRGIANEYQRVWQEKLMEHKMDLEHAFLFGVGKSNEVTTGPVRYTHGILPYTESNGKVYNFTYSASGYDAFLDAMEDFFAPESGNSGNKLVLASRKVITYLNKLGNGSFLNNTIGASQYNLDVQSIKGAFGHTVTKVNTIYGNLHFVADPLLRGIWENYCVAVDMKNVAYRPLTGNGVNRDTFIETNIQANDEDGRRDQIITEAGLEISLPETHAILKWS
jgi:hypothetical protein